MDTFNQSSDFEEGSATHRVYRALRSMIVRGVLKPGEKLKIEGLSKRLGTGASPVREALSLLTSDSLVERIDQRGFRTAGISATNFAEILKLRCVLEDLALRESIANATQDWEERVVLAHHRMQRAQNRKTEDFEDLHKAFHMSLLSNAQSPILLQICSRLYDLNIRYRYLAGHDISYQQRDVAKEHADILAAVLALDADTASTRLLEHYKTTGAFLSGLLGDGALA
ncbi:GntR family transcriptional regulator [Ruegeria marina]|uniref:Transcriptional regulator, GntR family n=1 Tax=Ruegeria marina TaxID=639004 RepID=A0A1G7DVC9_9RHOB|nr:GntR family transcriptional regulator [Ruegeria marina]SDE55457.1 transcriptional regulator, GntR family [Ruegeria marina]